MPDFTGSANSIRASGHSLRVFASFYKGELVYSTDITAIAGTPPIALIVTSVEPTYDHADIRAGFRVDILTPGGDYKGSTRVRFGQTITDTVIHIRETSYAGIDFEVGDLVKVYNDLRLADKLVTANEWFNPDDTGYSDQGSNPPPLARSGGHWAGRVNNGETFATVPMTGSTSEVVDPDSTPGNVSHLWTLPSDVAFQAGSANTDADPILEADVGQHLILHTVTDDDNSKAVTQSVVIMVTDNNTPPHRVLVTGYTGRPEDGFNWNAQVVSGAVDTDTIPDGCLCILWARERINNAWQSIRNNSDGREHILAVGYVRRERIRRAANGVNVLEFEFVSPLTRLREITAYSKVMEESASPDSWLEVKTLGVQRAFVQMIQFYTTLVESGFDFLIDDDFLDQRYPAFYLQRNTVQGMLGELATGQDARVTCDRTGQFLLATHPAFIALADRSSTTVAWALTARDVLDVDINVDHYPAVEQYKTSGFSGGVSGNEPLFSLYPGSAPGIGTQTPARDRLIVTDQDDLNERTGRYGALADRVLVDSSGKRHPAAEITITLRGVYNFFDFRNEYVTLTDDYGRRLYNAARFYPTDVTVGFLSNGTATTRVTLMQETHAPAGETFIPPEQYVAPYTPIPYTPQPFAPAPYTSRIPLYTTDTLPTKLFVLDAGGAHASIATAWNPLLSSLVYTDISTGLGSGYGIWACADPFDYRRRFALMSDGLYRCDNIWSGSPSWSLVASSTTLFGASNRVGTFVGMSINRKGYLYITSGNNAFVYSFDYGATWHVSSVDGGSLSYSTSLTSHPAWVNALVSPHNSSAAGNGWVYATTGTMYFGAGNTFRLRKSTDWGATWAAIADRDDFGFSTNQTEPCNLHIPYTRIDGVTPNENDSSLELYLLQDDASKISLSQNGGLSGSFRQRAGCANSVSGWQMMTFTHDGAKIAMAQRGHGLNTSPGIIISDDAAASEIRHTHLFAAGDQYVGLNGFSNHSQAWLLWCRLSVNTGDAKIIWTVDDGATYHSVATPSTFSGDKFPAYVEWDLSDFIAPA